MSARSVGSCNITLALLSVPVKLFTAASNEGIQFRMLSPDGNTVFQKYIDSVNEKQWSQGECLKGYEFENNKFVKFTKEEVKTLSADGENGIEIQEFVPADSVDLVCVEKSYYVKPGKGGDKAFRLLADAMERSSKAAVCQWISRGKEHLALVRPYKGGLILHTLYYCNEIRDYEDNCAKIAIGEVEKHLADQLIAAKSVSSFDSKKYSDTYTARVMEAIEEKKKDNSKDLVITSIKKEVSSDLFAGLQASLAALGAPKTEAPIEAFKEVANKASEKEKPKATRKKK